MSEKKSVKNPFNGVVNYFKDVRGEMKKVVWPTYKQLQKNTIIVLIAIVLIGLFIWALDFGFSRSLGTAVTKYNVENTQSTNNSSTQPSSEGTPVQQQVPASQ